jgi:serine/threonine protein kinase/serine/threonine protein phosphatase PrpC
MGRMGGDDDEIGQGGAGKDALPKKIGGYALGARIGRGAYGVVVHCEKGSKKYACKVINKHKLRMQASKTEAKKMEAGLKNEINTLKTLKHRNIVQLIYAEEKAGSIYMVLELMSGGELFDHIISKGTLSEREASAIIRQVASAIAYCESLDIIHRDLKPENLLLAKPQRLDLVKIADFGFAKILPSGNTTRSILGSPGYVAPEIRQGLEYDGGVDIWSLGVIIYVLLFGFTPFDCDTHVIPADADLEQRFRLDFEEEGWANVSTSAKDLIWRLLQPRPKLRLRPKDVLEHPWVTGRTATDNILNSVNHFTKKPKSRRRSMIGVANKSGEAFRKVLADKLRSGQLSLSEYNEQLSAPNLYKAADMKVRERRMTGASASEYGIRVDPGERVPDCSDRRITTCDRPVVITLPDCSNRNTNRSSGKRGKNKTYAQLKRLRVSYYSQKGFDSQDCQQPNLDAMSVVPSILGDGDLDFDLEDGADDGTAPAAASALGATSSSTHGRKKPASGRVSLFGVYDGHGSAGHYCSHFARSRVKRHLAARLRELRDEGRQLTDLKLEEAMIRAFDRTNEDLHAEKTIDDAWSGTTGCTVVIRAAEATLTIANTGDSRAVLGLHISNLLAREKTILGQRKGSALDLVGIVADSPRAGAGDAEARCKRSRLKGMGQSAANLFTGRSSAIQSSARRGSLKLTTTKKSTMTRKLSSSKHPSTSAEPPLPPGAQQALQESTMYVDADEEHIRSFPWLRFPVTAVPLSSDHTLWRSDERKRVRAIGARVLNMAQIEGHEEEHDHWDHTDEHSLESEMNADGPRLWAEDGEFPGTAFSRSIGDRGSEDIGLIATPEVEVHRLRGNERLVVLGTDGLFSFMSSQLVVDSAMEFNGDPTAACKAVVSKAYALWLNFETRTDHISVILIFLDWEKHDIKEGGSDDDSDSDSDSDDGNGSNRFKLGDTSLGGMTMTRKVSILSKEGPLQIRPVRTAAARTANGEATNARPVILRRPSNRTRVRLAEEAAEPFVPSEHAVPKQEVGPLCPCCVRPLATSYTNGLAH